MEKDPPSELAQLITKLCTFIQPIMLYTRTCSHDHATGPYHMLDESVSPSHIPLFLSVSVCLSNRLVSCDYFSLLRFTYYKIVHFSLLRACYVYIPIIIPLFDFLYEKWKMKTSTLHISVLLSSFLVRTFGLKYVPYDQIFKYVYSVYIGIVNSHFMLLL